MTCPDFRHLAQTLTLKVVPSPMSILALWRLTSQRRRVWRLEWLTALPVVGPRPQHWQIFATVFPSCLVHILKSKIAENRIQPFNINNIKNVKADSKNFTTSLSARIAIYCPRQGRRIKRPIWFSLSSYYPILPLSACVHLSLNNALYQHFWYITQ